MNPRDEKKAKSSSPVESKRTTRKRTKSPDVEINSPVKKPTKSVCACACACACVYLHVFTVLLFHFSDTTVPATAPSAPPKMTFTAQENIPPPSENIRQLSASPQKPKSPNLYPVLSELQQKLSTVNHGQPSSPTPSSQRTPVASPAAPKAASVPNHKVS